MNDIRYGLRLLRRSPAFTTVAVLSLGLGIGANTAIYSLIDAVILRPLPVPEPERLVTVTPAGTAGEGALSWAGFETLREQSRGFADTFTFASGDRWNAVVGGRPELVRGVLVSDNFFTALGVNAAAGRTFTPAGTDPVAVISDAYGRRKFELPEHAPGAEITINGAPFTIIGVLPREFFGVAVGTSPDVYIPIAMQPRINQGQSALADRYTWWLPAMARLRPGVTEDRAQAEFAVLLPAVQQAMGIGPSSRPDVFGRLQVKSASGGVSPLRGQFSSPLRILMLVVGLVLLLACANLANLLLSRATARRREIAVRLAVGGSRRRLIRQLVTESLLLAAFGGLAGLLFARWSSSALVAFLGTGPATVRLDLPLDLETLGFAALLTTATAVLFGVAPALRATRLDPASALKEDTRTVGGHGQAVSRTLVVAQIAISLVLLTAAGLFIRSLDNLRSKGLGFQPQDLLLLTVEPALAGYDDTRLLTFYRDLLERVERIPGVRVATLARFGLIGAGYGGRAVSSSAFTRNTAGGDVAYDPVGPRFFEASGIPIVEGRDFTAADDAGSPRAAIVNKRFARHYFGDESPLGRQITLAGMREPLQIVGVAGDSRFFRIRDDSSRTVYVPYPLTKGVGLERMVVQLRTTGDPGGVAEAALREVRALSRDVPISDVRTQRQQIDSVLVRERLLATLSGFFGGLALLLACIGLYGVLSYTVSRRRAEIGIRMALGARRSDVIRMVLRDTALLLGVGFALGLPGVLAGARLVQALVFAVEPTDPGLLATACLVLATAAALASGLPAWRAARVDPVSALRNE
jgi:predicted permease